LYTLELFFYFWTFN